MKKRSRNKARTVNFDVVINGQPVQVLATPYLVNGEVTRFRVSINESPVIIFGRNDQKNQLTALEGGHLQPTVEMVIASKLEEVERRLAA